jgi:hypothetical protein
MDTGLARIKRWFYEKCPLSGWKEGMKKAGG